MKIIGNNSSKSMGVVSNPSTPYQNNDDDVHDDVGIRQHEEQHHHRRMALEQILRELDDTDDYENHDVNDE
eukprot:4210787-Ditylum_brightwellii.AAC.1